MITTIIDGVLLLFWLGLMPGLTGCLWTRKLKNDRGNILLAYILGLFSCWPCLRRWPCP